MARILVLSPYEPPPDGIAKHTSHLVSAWDSAGHTVLVMAQGRHRSIGVAEPFGAHSRVARVLGKIPRRRAWNEVVDFDPDVVFVQFAIAAMSMNLWSIRSLCQQITAARIPVVVAFHEPAREYDLLGFVTRFIYKTMVHVTSVPVAFSVAGRDALIDNGLFAEVIEAPHGTEEVAEISDDELQRVRGLYQLRKPLVLTLGFTNPDKGTDVLLDAAGAIAKSQNNDVQFLIAGSPRQRRGLFRLMERRDVKYQAQLEERAKRSANADIAFCGFIPDDDVKALLFAAEVVALPYRSITQSGIANLALSSRSVVVASDLPGLRSDLGNAAVYVEVGNATAMASHIAALLSDGSASVRQHMRELSEERARANTFANVAEMILAAGLAVRTAENPS